MPIYEYQCSKCGNVFEVLQKFSDPPLKKHEKCGGKVEKLISRSGFQLKGGGWYATDYGSSSTPKDKASNSDSKSETASTDSKASGSSDSDSKSTETKTESKSPAKTESKPAKSKKD